MPSQLDEVSHIETASDGTIPWVNYRQTVIAQEEPPQYVDHPFGASSCGSLVVTTTRAASVAVLSVSASNGYVCTLHSFGAALSLIDKLL